MLFRSFNLPTHRSTGFGYLTSDSRRAHLVPRTLRCCVLVGFPVTPAFNALVSPLISPRWPYRFHPSNGDSLIEFPPSTLAIGDHRLPVAGGGYFRIYPYQLTRFALSRINRVEKRPFIFYLHPWEIDPGQPRVRANWLSTLRHYTNLSRCEKRLHQLLQDFVFTPAKQVLDGLVVPTLSTVI